MTHPAPDHSQTMTFADQLLNRDALQGGAVCLDKVEHFPHSIFMTAIAVTGDRRAFLVPKSKEGLGNYFLGRSKVTGLQLVVDDPFLFGSQIDIHDRKVLCRRSNHRLKWRAAQSLEVLGAKAELGENLFMGNAFATCKGSLGFLKLASLFRSHRFVVIRSTGQGASERVEDDFQETNHGGDLAGSHAVDQLVRVLFLVRETVRHEISLAKSTAPR